MAHPQQLKFFKLIQQHFISTKQNEKIKILEIGSYNVNGSIREFMENSNTEYVGVDLCEGHGVDIVSYGHKLELPNNNFQISISGECFEHDENWVATFNNMYRMTCDGGIVAFTCATHGRLEHGTSRSAANHSPGTQSLGLDYYKNLTKQDFYDNFDIASMFSEHYFFYEKSSFDLYFIGWKAGKKIFAGNTKAFLEEVANIHKVGKFRIKLFDIPIYIARKTLNEHQFQDFSCQYLQKIRPFRQFIKSLSKRKRAS